MLQRAILETREWCRIYCLVIEEICFSFKCFSIQPLLYVWPFAPTTGSVNGSRASGYVIVVMNSSDKLVLSIISGGKNEYGM